MLQTNKKIEIANLEREKKSKETTEMAQLLEAEEEAEKKKRQAKEAEEEAEKKKRQAEEAEKKKKEATEAAKKKTRERIKFLEVKTFWLRSKIITQEYTRKFILHMNIIIYECTPPIGFCD